MKAKPYVVSLIGRPNVGKSTIFNRLMGNSVKAITYDREGVTRDRHYAITRFDELSQQQACDVILVDTGGFFPDENSQTATLEGISLLEIAQQAKLAIEESDLVLVVMDIRQGALPADEEIVQYLRKQKKNFLLLLNKYDTDQLENEQADFYQLGIDQSQLHLISAEHGRGVQSLKEKIQASAQEDQRLAHQKLLHKGVSPRHEVMAKVAIIGAPNAGKSTLLNQLLGAPRAVISPTAGTTVDPIEGYFDLNFAGYDHILNHDYFQHKKDNLSLLNPDDDQDWEMPELSEREVKKLEPVYKSVMVVDTAGIRKMGSVEGNIEQQSVYRSLRAIAESDIVIHLIDATKGITHQDRKLMGIAIDRGASLLVAINKIDLIQETFNDTKKRKEWLDHLRFKIPWLNFCEILPICAEKAQRLTRLKHVLKRTILTRHQKLPTGELNRCVQDLMNRHSLTVNRSRQLVLKLKYATQVKASPPTIMLVTNRSKDIPDQYRRFLVSGIRNHFALANTPLHLVFKTSAELKV